MKIKDLSNDQLIEQIIPLAIEYKRRFGKSLGITSEVGECLNIDSVHSDR